MNSWSIEEWCDEQVVPSSDWSSSSLAASSASFLNQLNLSSTHPFCDDFTDATYGLDGVPPQGPLLSKDHLESVADVVLSLIAMTVPALAAMGELWLRLFASGIAPLGMAHMMRTMLLVWSSAPVSSNDNKTLSHKTLPLVIVLTMASCTVLVTDTLYILDYGPSYGCGLLALSTLVSLSLCRTLSMVKTAVAVMGILVLTVCLTVGFDGSLTFGNAADTVQIDEGLYYDPTNARTSRIVENWPKSYWTYDHTVATRWTPTGDARTGIPFLLNKVPEPSWTRVWLPVEDGEVVAFDVAFPPDTGHSTTLPVYLILHGLNGGSSEEYVKDFALRQTARGSTVVVMIARGLMDLPIRSMNVFHGARWQDAHAASLALRDAMTDGQLLAGVGYSMGAIILNNLVTRTGSECALDAAVSISGGLDMRQEIDFTRAQRLWQPILAAELRDAFVMGKWGERVRQRLSKAELKKLMRATHISEVDKTAVVAYNGFRDLVHYYSEMSALGDIPYESNGYFEEEIPSMRRIHNIAIPFCVVHALDDPLVTWRSVAANDGLMHPQNLTVTGSGNLLVLLTRKGGHVGWPTGWLPFVDKWKWMSDVSMSFISALDKI